VAAGVVVGFPLFTPLALQRTDSAHGAAIVGLLPEATAVLAVLRTGERHPGRSRSPALPTIEIVVWPACLNDAVRGQESRTAVMMRQAIHPVREAQVGLEPAVVFEGGEARPTSSERLGSGRRLA